MEQNWRGFKEDFEKFVVGDIEKALRADIEVGTIILTVIGIECLSGYLAGKRSNRDTFLSFVKRFMPVYSCCATMLYGCVRNGLAHDYIIKESDGRSFWFTRNRGEEHLTPVKGKDGWFYLNREQFALDFLTARTDFFKQVEEDNELFEKAKKRLKSTGSLVVLSLHNGPIFVDPADNQDTYNGVTGTFC